MPRPRPSANKVGSKTRKITVMGEIPQSRYTVERLGSPGFKAGTIKKFVGSQRAGRVVVAEAAGLGPGRWGAGSTANRRVI